MALLNEAVDKCGFWSSLLHVYYMFAYMNGLKRDDVLCYVLFFAHQCNSTIIIVQSMLDIMRSTLKEKMSDSLYTLLAKACKKYKVKDNWSDVGCGGGGYERFSPSSNLIYREEKVRSIIHSLNKIFAETTCDFEEKLQKKLTPSICFNSYFELETKLLTIFEGSGIAKVRVCHLIQLSALLGLIPFHFYVYLPIHMSGGTGSYLTNELGYCGNKINMEQYIQDLTLLQNIYGINFTSNMFENISCILGRKKEVYDVFYFLPWVTKDNEDDIPHLSDKSSVQLTFRVNVKTIKNIELLCVSNRKESTVLSAQSSKSSLPVLQYHKTKMSESKHDCMFLIAESGHTVNDEWMLDQYKSVFTTDQNITYSLPNFDHFYNDVSL